MNPRWFRLSPHLIAIVALLAIPTATLLAYLARDRRVTLGPDEWLAAPPAGLDTDAGWEMDSTGFWEVLDASVPRAVAAVGARAAVEITAEEASELTGGKYRSPSDLRAFLVRGVRLQGRHGRCLPTTLESS